MGTVMVVDDQERMRTMLCRLLAAEGHVTEPIPDGEIALARLAEDCVDLVLLDLVLPGANGLQVLSRLRERGCTSPVIVLSAVPDIAARVDALDLGAVDFVPKPFHSAELVARVRRILANHPSVQSVETRYLEHCGVRLDLDRRRAFWRGSEVPLTEREFGLLAHLMRRHGRVCRRAELLKDVWGLDFEPGTNVLEVCVRRLRNKLPEVPIETVRSVGYCFTED
jgi:DNA-binding response OmpR family regulator